jgi:repressor LexA
MGELTRRQQDVLTKIGQFFEETGHPPTVRELGALLGVRSSCTVQRHLESLERKGFIQRHPTKARTLEILRGPKPLSRAAADGGLISLPILGVVTAGQPILAVEHIEDSLAMPRSLLPAGECFALRVRGESMIDAGLYDGDLAIVLQQTTARNGDIVVALLEDEATIKRFFREKRRFRLQPENATMAPIITSHVTILGKVVMSIHHF